MLKGAFVIVLRGHVGPVYQISWSADSRLLLSGSKDSILKWMVGCENWALDQFLDTGVFSVDWSPDGEEVASGDKDKILKLWMG
ncbi:notchless-like protein [Trifolium medium]|uniref:Notchless-like protein n=1 Tax=Trifolium medium TaxID=97028 RepID=A0A392M142_9FABA|nr:notchless-like protein [Trifolium medium]